MAKHLFICTANIQRSKTAEDHFQIHYPQHQFQSAGLNQRICEQYGTTLVSVEMLKWADRIWVMEQKHFERIKEHTQDQFLGKITVLYIEDIYPYNAPELIQVLEQKIVIQLLY